MQVHTQVNRCRRPITGTVDNGITVKHRIRCKNDKNVWNECINFLKFLSVYLNSDAMTFASFVV